MNIISKNNIQNFIIILTSYFLYKKFGGTFLSLMPNLLLMFIMIILSLKSDYKLIKSNIINLVFLLLVLLLFSILWSDAPNYGLTKIINVFITCILFYIIFETINKKFELFFYTNIIFWIIFILNLYIEFGSFLNLLNSLDLRFRLGMEMGESISSLHPISITRYLGFLLLSLITWVIIVKKFNVNLYFYFLSLPIIVISIIYMFFSGTKAPILALVLSIITFIIFSKNSKRIYSLIFFIISSIILIIYTTIDIKSTNLLTKDQKTYIEYRFFSSDKGIEDRSYQNLRAINSINENNFLFGAGSGDFAYLYNKKDTRDYPHNIFSEILYENGIFAVAILLFMYFYILYLFSKSINYKTITFSMFYFYFFFNSLFSGDLISNNLIFGFFILSVLSYKSEKSNQIKE